MHLSLALFLVGLVLFLIPLQLVLACTIGGITVVVYTFYLVTNMLPIYFPECPYRTPLSDFILAFGSLLRRLITALEGLRLLKERVFGKVDDHGRPLKKAYSATADRSRKEKDAVARMDDTLSVDSLHWLYSVSSNPSVHSVVVQAIGGLPVGAAKEVRQRFSNKAFTDLHQGLLMRNCTIPKLAGNGPLMPRHGLETVVERLCRSSLIPNLHHRWRVHDPLPKWNVDFRLNAEVDPNPIYMATSLACDAMSVPHSVPADTLKRFIMSSSTPSAEVRHHPLVWIAVVQDAIWQNAFADFQNDPEVFKLLFHALWDEPPKKRKIEPLYTPIEVMRLYMHKELCDYLLDVCVNSGAVHSDTPTAASYLLSSSEDVAVRLLIVTMEFVLHQVSLEPRNFDSVCWRIIDYTLNRYSSTPMLVAQRSFFGSFVGQLIKNTDVCVSEAPHDASAAEVKRMLRNEVLLVYIATTKHTQQPVLVLHDSLYSDSFPHGFSLLRRAIEGSLRDITHGVVSTDLKLVFRILMLALREGRAEAYQLVKEYDFLQMLCRYRTERAPVSDVSEFVSRFVGGLASKGPGFEPAVQNACVDYLFEVKSLRIAVIGLAIWNEDRPKREENVRMHMERVAKLRPDPDKTAWGECQQWLTHVVKWVAEGKDPSRFEELGLGEEWMMRGLVIHLKDSRNLETAIQWLGEKDSMGTSTTAQTHPNHNISPPALANPISVSYRRRQDLGWILPSIPKLLRRREAEQQVSIELV